MNSSAGASRLAVLFGVTLVALIALIFYTFRPNPRWKYTYHIVLQSAPRQKPDPAPWEPDQWDQTKLGAALGKLDPSVFNIKWDGKPFPSPSPGSGGGSADTDGGAGDGHKPTVHVTQQVSFNSAKDLADFINANFPTPTPTMSSSP